MAATTPFFQAFGPLLFGRPARRDLQKIVRLDSLAELYELFGHLLPERLLAPTQAGTGSRQRLFSTQVTFWAFVAQVLSPGTACREIVRRVEAWWQEQAGDGPPPSVSTSAYCQARARLDPATLELVRAELCWSLERNVLQEEPWLSGRPVKIVDGTCLSMPDTPDNQARWPQSSEQPPGCGFPCLKLVGLFSLSSGALLAAQNGNLHAHFEHAPSPLVGEAAGRRHRPGRPGVLLLRRPGRAPATAGRRQSVMRLHQKRPADFRCGRRLGPEDRLVTWQKPSQRTESWSAAEFAALPPSLSLRMIRLRVTARGFRTQSVVLVTTLVDPVAYPAEALRALYGQRWQVEGHFAQIKTSLGMDVLRCKSPELIEREVLMHQIAYNLVRCLMQRAAHGHHVPLTRLSFKGTLDTLRHWSGLIAAAGKTPRRQQTLITQMLALIAADPVPERPGRSEPRARKRRGKNYQLLTRPRHQMVHLPRRNRAKAKAPKPVLS